MAMPLPSTRSESRPTLRGTVFAAIGLLLGPGCADRVYRDDGPVGDDAADESDGDGSDGDGSDGTQTDGDGDDGTAVCIDNYDAWGVVLVCEH